MKVKLLVAIFFLTIHFGFSQSEKLINGKVLSEQIPVSKVEVANYNSKIVVLTDISGNFVILVKPGDELVFISKNHDIKKIIVNQKIIKSNGLTISLNLKTEQLDEVVITKIPSIKLSKDAKWEQGKLDSYNLEKAANIAKVIGVNIVTIENGMDLMRIGGMLMSLLKKEKDIVKIKTNKIEFTTIAKRICDQNFFLKTLQLKPDEIELFLQYCNADPKSKTLLENTNILSMMDFLITKNIDFQKLKNLD